MANFTKTNKFVEMAKKETTLSRLLAGRTKIETEDVIKNYPDGVTLIEFDYIEQNEQAYPIFCIAENKEVCFFGGLVLDKIARKWIEAYEGDIEMASDDLKTSGGVKVKLSTKKTSTGKTITSVEVLG